MRFATWNVNSVKARLPRLLGWLDSAGPDVVCLQETKCADDAFPAQEVADLGYATAAHGDGRWNGVAILSKVGLADVVRGFPGEPVYAPDADPGGAEPATLPGLAEAPAPGPEARCVSATCAGVRFWSVYVPNGRTPDSPHYRYKLDWLAALRDALRDVLPTHPRLAVCGDYNVAPTDADVWDPSVFIGSTHVTPPERAALAALRELGLTDVVPRPMKGPNPFTYWDYRAGMFHKDQGMRIDLVYATPTLAGEAFSAVIDREARKGTGPSDHAPVIVDTESFST